MGNCITSCASNFATGFVVNHDKSGMVYYPRNTKFEWCGDNNRVHLWVHNGCGGLRSDGYGYFVKNVFVR